MATQSQDTLLVFAATFVRLLQWACGLAGGLLALLTPVVLLLGQGMLPGLSDNFQSDVLAASPLAVVAIFALLALTLAALFRFFGHLRAIIVSAGEGDPFTLQNAGRLNAMAWLFLGVKILSLLVGALRLHVANLVRLEGSGRDSLDFSVYDLNAVIIVLVLFTLARVFRQGAAMREDLNGTV